MNGLENYRTVAIERKTNKKRMAIYLNVCHLNVNIYFQLILIINTFTDEKNADFEYSNRVSERFVLCEHYTCANSDSFRTHIRTQTYTQKNILCRF